MRKSLVFLILFATLLSFTGCKDLIQSSTEINKLEFVRSIALDRSTDKAGYIKLTITSISAKMTGKSEERQSETFYSEGKTVSEAVRNFHTYLDRKPFLGHINYILIGEGAAEDGILKYIDFFSRENAIRMNAKVFVIKGGRAEDVLKKASKKDAVVNNGLDSLIKSQGGKSISTLEELTEVMYILDSKFLSLFIPCIELVKMSQDGQDKGSMDIKMGGFAIFDGDKLAGYLDDRQSRGLNWLMNRIKSGIITVKSPKGSEISLEIIDTNIKKIPKIIDGELTITVKIQMSSNIGEMQSSEDVFNSKTFEYLNIQQEQIIKDEVKNVLKIAQQKHMDFFSTGSAVHHKYPIKWQDMYEKNWRAIFSNTKFNVVVEGKINRTYNIIQPNSYKEDEKQ